MENWNDIMENDNENNDDDDDDDAANAASGWKTVDTHSRKKLKNRQQYHHHHHRQQPQQQQQRQQQHLKNTIIIKYEYNRLIIRGDKSKYGLIIGEGGKTLTQIRKKCSKAKITIPEKDNYSNEIIIEGQDRNYALYEILHKIIPQPKT